MSSSRRCSECGKPLPDEIPSGPCPECALRGALGLSRAEAGPPRTEQVGQVIGPYRLVERIGEGGYGVVYRAAQSAPLRRVVALKVIKLGMDTQRVIARFEAERQALALMDHPNIAKVLDAGATESGRPYFVMELVDGARITDYADRQKLSTRERLDLFVQVCRAVQHAHQKGIIHRDLKPSNILVAVHDGVPVPKVIDFGIAKATQEPLGERTVSTGVEQFLGTPAYMSPEQAGLGSRDVDTRSDIYSLGVLLYELLTGSTPFERRELLKSGLEEMRRMIREKEPAKPSTRLTGMSGERLSEVAKQQRTEAGQLLELVRGDLDWIAMKCLEKERGRRYESASGLARDIERHLQNEPVTAAPPSAGYRIKKFVRRHRVGLSVTAMLVLLLLAGIFASTWEAVRATRAEQQQALLRRQAEAAEQASRTEAAKSGQVARFLTDMLDGVGPSVALGRDTKMLHEILDKTAERVAKDLKTQPEVEAELCNTIGNVYEELGDYPRAEAIIRQALTLRTNLFGEKHVRVADSLMDLGNVRRDRGHATEAEVLYRRVLAMRRDLLGNQTPEVATALNNLGTALLDQGELIKAEQIYREALALRKQLFGEEHLEVALSLHNLGNVLLMEGKNAEAESLFRAALALRRKLLGNEHPLLATTLGNLGTALWYQSKFPEAESIYRETLAMQQKLLGEEHPDVATSLHNLACVLQSQGKNSDAELFCKQALGLRRRLLGAEHPEFASTLSALAAIYQGQGRFADAETTQRQAIAIQRKQLGEEHLDTAVSLSNLGDILRVEGNLPEAETVQRQAVATLKKVLGDQHQLVAAALDVLGNVLRDQQKFIEAESCQRDALAMRRKVLANEHPDIAQSLNDLASVLQNRGRLQEAETLYREALSMRRRLLGNEHPDTIDSFLGLTALLQAEGKLPEAEGLAREYLPASEKLNADWRISDSQARLGSILLAQKKYAQAEPLLLAGYAGLEQRRTSTPVNCRPRLKETAKDIAALYEATASSNKAADWKQRLQE